MKKINSLSIAAVLSLVSVLSWAQDNQLTSKENAEGWQLLFNGQDMSQWRNYQQPDLDSKWQVEHGAMVLTAKGGGDILTRKSYKNFELQLEWNISQAGNSGIFILVDELGSQIYSHAIEVQILDNQRHPDNKLASHLSGSIYDMIAAPKASQKLAGQWNQVRIVYQDKQLKVWQNQVLTTDIMVDSKRWQQLLAQSKFASWQGFAQAEQGHIGLQDHGDRVAFKNIKIKEL